MRIRLPLTVYVAAILAGQLSVDAEQPPVPGLQSRLPANMQAIDAPRPPVFNGFAQYRAVPDHGAPGSAGHGFSHFMMPADKYTTWYRPRAATLTANERCAPDLFRPRGYGNLFARPCDGYRIDYSPFVLSEGSSPYGPSYFARQPDGRCDSHDCDHGDCKSDECRK